MVPQLLPPEELPWFMWLGGKFNNSRGNLLKVCQGNLWARTSESTDIFRTPVNAVSALITQRSVVSTADKGVLLFEPTVAAEVCSMLIRWRLSRSRAIPRAGVAAEVAAQTMSLCEPSFLGGITRPVIPL